jgi:5-methylcytosine-specific restriction endonuclease McrA
MNVKPTGADKPSQRPPGMKERPRHPNSTHSGKLRRVNVIVRDKGICQSCGLLAAPPEMHHRDGNRDNQSMENLVLLCGPCHFRVHGGSWRNHPEDIPPLFDHGAKR